MSAALSAPALGGAERPGEDPEEDPEEVRTSHLAGSVRTDDEAVDRLRSELRSLGHVVVAFSGGADSAFLAWMATDVLGTSRVMCATAVSPSLAPSELAECRALAGEWGLRWTEVVTDELADPAYVANDGLRCFHCKSSLMKALAPIVGSEQDAAPASTVVSVVLGVNVDDLGDHRPGQQAAAQAGATFPLVAAGFTKEAVRRWSRALGLRTWDKPAAACLASRVPYGTPVTIGTLRRVALAEEALRGLGFGQLRVRHYGDTARLEVPLDDLAVVVERREQVAVAVHDAGYRYVTLDLDGFRSGNLNTALAVGGTGSGRPPAAKGTSANPDGTSASPGVDGCGGRHDVGGAWDDQVGGDR
ncbi:MAG: ATP-dependent sacrificial sulfur transferase LarE [Acidimicrobiales bacterium]